MKEKAICDFLKSMQDMIKNYPTELKNNKDYQHDTQEYLKLIDEHINQIRNNLDVLQESNLATPKRQHEYQSNLKGILQMTEWEIKHSPTTPCESPHQIINDKGNYKTKKK